MGMMVRTIVVMALIRAAKLQHEPMAAAHIGEVSTVRRFEARAH
jgi:hypothetical protein